MRRLGNLFKFPKIFNHQVDFNTHIIFADHDNSSIDTDYSSSSSLSCYVQEGGEPSLNSSPANTPINNQPVNTTEYSDHRLNTFKKYMSKDGQNWRDNDVSDEKDSDRSRRYN